MSTRVHMYTRFERFWHWSQAALVLSLGLTGFEIHGSYTLLGFERAVEVHSTLVWALMGLWVFAIFWHFTTGEWRSYVPTLRLLPQVVRHYAWGIFRNEDHPWPKGPGAKLNPLQRFAYLGLKLGINPVLWISGLFYLFYHSLGLSGLVELGTIALIHTAGAWAMAVFVIVHVYLTTTGHTLFAYHKAMITGWEDLHTPPAPATKGEKEP